MHALKACNGKFVVRGYLRPLQRLAERECLAGLDPCLQDGLAVPLRLGRAEMLRPRGRNQPAPLSIEVLGKLSAQPTEKRVRGSAARPEAGIGPQHRIAS